MRKRCDFYESISDFSFSTPRKLWLIKITGCIHSSRSSRCFDKNARLCYLLRADATKQVSINGSKARTAVKEYLGSIPRSLIYRRLEYTVSINWPNGPFCDCEDLRVIGPIILIEEVHFCSTPARLHDWKVVHGSACHLRRASHDLIDQVAAFVTATIIKPPAWVLFPLKWSVYVPCRLYDIWEKSSAKSLIDQAGCDRDDCRPISLDLVLVGKASSCSTPAA